MPWLTYEQFLKTKDAIKDILERYDISCMCGKKLLPNSIDFSASTPLTKYGFNQEDVRPQDKEYWIYAHCKCGYDYNYEKIIRQWWKKSTIMKLADEFQEEWK